MVKIQLDISKELSDKLGIYKIQNKLDTKADSIIKICNEAFKGVRD